MASFRFGFTRPLPCPACGNGMSDNLPRPATAEEIGKRLGCPDHCGGCLNCWGPPLDPYGERDALARRVDAVRAYLVEIDAEVGSLARATVYLDGWADGVLKLSGDLRALLDGTPGDE